MDLDQRIISSLLTLVLTLMDYTSPSQLERIRPRIISVKGRFSVVDLLKVFDVKGCACSAKSVRNIDHVSIVIDPL